MKLTPFGRAYWMKMKSVSENIYRVIDFSDDDVFAKTTPEVWLDFWIEVFTRDPTPRNIIHTEIKSSHGI
jgi:hypothetical protein